MFFHSFVFVTCVCVHSATFIVNSAWCLMSNECLLLIIIIGVKLLTCGNCKGGVF